MFFFHQVSKIIFIPFLHIFLILMWRNYDSWLPACFIAIYNITLPPVDFFFHSLHSSWIPFLFTMPSKCPTEPLNYLGMYFGCMTPVGADFLIYNFNISVFHSPWHTPHSAFPSQGAEAGVAASYGRIYMRLGFVQNQQRNSCSK